MNIADIFTGRRAAAAIVGLVISVISPGGQEPIWSILIPALYVAAALAVVEVRPRFRRQAAVTVVAMLGVVHGLRMASTAAAKLVPLNGNPGNGRLFAHVAILAVGAAAACGVSYVGWRYTKVRLPRRPPLLAVVTGDGGEAVPLIDAA